MPRSGMETPAGVTLRAVGGRRRDRRSRYGLIVSALPTPFPAKPNPLKATPVDDLRRRSGHDKAWPKSGRISALAGRQGRLRACTESCQQHHPQRH